MRQAVLGTLREDWALIAEHLGTTMSSAQTVYWQMRQAGDPGAFCFLLLTWRPGHLLAGAAGGGLTWGILVGGWVGKGGVGGGFGRGVAGGGWASAAG